MSCLFAACEHGRFKSVCWVPYFIIVLFVLLCTVAGLMMVTIFGFHGFSETHSKTGVSYTVINSIMIALGSIVGLAILANIYTWMRAIVYLAVPTRRQVNNHHNDYKPETRMLVLIRTKFSLSVRHHNDSKLQFSLISFK